MTSSALAILGLVLMLICLLLVPLGLPGVWIMLLVPTVGTYFGDVGVVTYAVLIGIALVAELAEYVVIQQTTARYGASRRAFWGALGGGLVGGIVGTPIPVLGNLVGVFVGTFAGALLVAYAESRAAADSARVGWGAVVGRTLAAGVKILAGLAIIVVTAGALLAG
ncbi:MAG: DUF456 domain-containing protein [Gemmatimonadota bacterium]